MKISFKKIVSCLAMLLLVGGIFVVPKSSNAAESNPINNDSNASYQLLEPLPCISSPALKNEKGEVIPGTEVVCSGEQKTSINFREYVQYAFNLLIALAAVAAVFMIVWGGFQYMSSDAYNKKTEGLRKLENAIYGLLLVLCSYLILRTVDPRLVQIPSTLVAPLDIKYKPAEVADFFKQMTDDANQYRKQNMDLINKVYEAQSKVDALTKKKAELNSKLGEILYDEGAADNDPRVLDLKRQMAEIDGQVKDINTKMAEDTARGIMNAAIQQCYGITTDSSSIGFKNYGNGFSLKDCADTISSVTAKYSANLDKTGDGLAAQRVRDYGTYSQSIAKINTTILTRMSSSPAAKAAVDSLQTVVTTGTTAAGAVLGGPVGAGAGLVVSQLANTAIAAIPANEKGKAATLTIAQIQYEVNQNANKILDDDIRKIYTTQANKLIVSLGGQGNGKDSTKPYEDYLKESEMPLYEAPLY